MTDKDNPRLETDPATAELMERILYEVKRVVVGQDRFLERVMVALLAGGHLLVEGVPGLAKTLTVKTLAGINLQMPISSSWQRVKAAKPTFSNTSKSRTTDLNSFNLASWLSLRW